MSTDIEDRLRADGEQWRRHQSPVPRMIVPADCDVIELEPGPARPPRGRRAWVAVLAAAIVIAAVAVFGVVLTRDHSQPAAGGLAGTTWAEPGANTIAFGPAGDSITWLGACGPSSYRLVLHPKSFEVGSGLSLSRCRTGAFHPVMQIPTPPNPYAMTDVSKFGSRVAWSRRGGLLTLSDGRHRATLIEASHVRTICSATTARLTVGDQLVATTIGASRRSITVTAPARTTLTLSGPCRSGVVADLWLDDGLSDQPTAFGQWTLRRTGRYELRLGIYERTSTIWPPYRQVNLRTTVIIDVR